MANWKKVQIKTDHGNIVDGSAPVIISASRSTDIPAYYSEWFINRLKKGYLVWINPFNGKDYYISFEECKLVVFWTKDPEPILSHLEILNNKGINYYFQFTLNDYENENLEPNVSPLKKRINTFITLSRKIGKERVIWRFDPLLLSEEININDLIKRMKNIADQIYNFTDKLVISFIDIKEYVKVTSNLKNIDCREFTKKEVYDFSSLLSDFRSQYNLEISTCAESYDLSEFGINHNRCIDDELIVQEFYKDNELMNFIGCDQNKQQSLFSDSCYEHNKKLEDKGQRKHCGCIISKDIGMYNTCKHLCKYCYANHSTKKVINNYKNHNPSYHSIVKL